MDYSTEEHLKKKLRGNFSKFLSQFKMRSCGFRKLENLIKGTTITTYAFGGTARDALIKGPHFRPRDLDLVMDNLDFQQFKERLSPYIKRTNSFGGLKIQIDDLEVDAWATDNTWAFRQGYLSSRKIKDLPETTYISLDSILIELFPQTRKRRIFESRFFESFQNKCIFLKLDDNPYPELCILRTLFYSEKYQLMISKELGKSIIYYAQRTSPHALLEMQLRHYQKEFFNQNKIDEFILNIKSGLHRNQEKIKTYTVLNQELLEVQESPNFYKAFS